MNNHTEIVGIFSTPIHFSICDDDITQSIEFLESANMKSRICPKGKLDYGSISEDTYILDNENCIPLKNFILKNLETYAKQVLAYKFKSLVLTQSWVSIKEPGEKHIYHRHPNSLISGIFYWQDPPFEGITFKRDKKTSHFEIDRDPSIQSHYAWDLHHFKPLKNTLILFPSDLEHGVQENSYSKNRKSLSFNSMISEIIGISDSLTEMSFSRLNNC
jgi:hypothetical protein